MSDYKSGKPAFIISIVILIVAIIIAVVASCISFYLLYSGGLPTP